MLEAGVPDIVEHIYHIYSKGTYTTIVYCRLQYAWCGPMALWLWDIITVISIDY